MNDHRRSCLRTRRTAALLVYVAGTLACQPREEPVVTAIGALAVVTFERSLCGADIATIENTLLHAADELDVEPSVPVEVYLYNRYEDVVARCGSGPSGCFINGEIHTLWQSLEHELIHAVAEPLGTPSPLWAEGIAEALSDRTQRGEQTVSSQIDLDDARDLDYATAGHFVRWLRDNYGAFGLRALSRESSFEDAYNRELAEAVAEYEEDAPWSYPHWKPCTGSHLDATAAHRWSHEIEVNCEDPWGSTQYDSGPTVFRTIDIKEPGVYRLVVAGGDRVGATMCQLGLLDEQPTEAFAGDIILESSGLDLPTFFAGGEAYEVRLEPGRLRLSITVEGEAALVGFTLDRIGP